MHNTQFMLHDAQKISGGVKESFYSEASTENVTGFIALYSDSLLYINYMKYFLFASLEIWLQLGTRCM